MDILLVDDEEIIHQTLGKVLDRSGHSVMGAHNGVEALRRLDESIPDLIISDIKMPVMDGLELVRKLRFIAPTTPSVLITGHGDENMAIAALQHGAYDYLRKPVKLDLLFELIDRISKRKELEESVLSQRMQPRTPVQLAAISRLAAGVSSQICNPSTMMSGNLHLLRELARQLAPLMREACGARKDAAVMGARLDEFLELIDDTLQGAERISEVVQQMQACARTWTPRASDRVDLWDCAEAVREGVGPSAHGVALTLEGRHLTVQGVAAELREAVSALVTNALQALEGHPGGRVSVTVDAHEAGWVTVAVHDNGPGIPDEIADQIFEPFFTTRDPGKGLGLGLTLCQRIIEGHGGHIGFISRPREGARFSLHLPCAREHASLSEPRVSALDPLASTSA